MDSEGTRSSESPKHGGCCGGSTGSRARGECAVTPKSPADIKDFSVPLNLFREDLEVQGVPCVHWSHGRGTLITVGGAPLILENISSLSRGFLESHMDPGVEEWALDLREHLGRMQLSKTLGEGQLCPRCIQGTGELSRESCARG